MVRRSEPQTIVALDGKPILTTEDIQRSLDRVRRNRRRAMLKPPPPLPGIPCAQCAAEPGQPCQRRGKPRSIHPERKRLWASEAENRRVAAALEAPCRTCHARPREICRPVGERGPCGSHPWRIKMAKKALKNQLRAIASA